MTGGIATMALLMTNVTARSALITEEAAHAIGVDAYLYFYPLLTMDLTRDAGRLAVLEIRLRFCGLYQQDGFERSLHPRRREFLSKFTMKYRPQNWPQNQMKEQQQKERI